MAADDYPQYFGDRSLLERRKWAFMCSRQFTSGSVLRCYDWATSLDGDRDCVVGGFQSDIERDVLRLLAMKRIPAVLVLGRRLYQDGAPPWMRPHIDAGLGLVVALTNAVGNCVRNVALRNSRVVEMADEVVFGTLNTGGTLMPIYWQARRMGKPVTVLQPGWQEPTAVGDTGQEAPSASDETDARAD